MEQEKYEILISLANDAIEKCLERLTKLHPIDDLYEMQQFARGLALIARLRSKAKEKSLDDMSLPSAKRPGIGLSRGFGEFECGDEVMDAIHKLERYYHSM